LVTDAASELRAAYAFIDELEASVAAAGLLVEATERRLEALERNEPLPDSLATLPPAMFTNRQFTRQVRRGERIAPPDLPELTLLPPSRHATSTAASGRLTSASPAGGTSTNAADELLDGALELKKIASSAASRARERAQSLWSSSGRWRDSLMSMIE
jgi:hypothetical protein